MSKEIRNDLEKLKDLVPDEGDKPVEDPETPKVEEKKAGFVGRMGMKLCAIDEKRSERKEAKLKAAEEKKLAKEKKISKGKVFAGVVAGIAVLGAVGKAICRVAANADQNCCETDEDLVELDDTSVEETTSE